MGGFLTTYTRQTHGVDVNHILLDAARGIAVNFEGNVRLLRVCSTRSMFIRALNLSERI